MQFEWLIEAFDEEGLAETAPAFVGDYFPDSTPKELASKKGLCAGAEPIVHSHFFDDCGAFGSLTEHLDQVDDGSYEIAANFTVLISKEFGEVGFHHDVRGDKLSLSPFVTQAMKREALGHPLDFTAAGWTITMSYPGQAWKRVDCNGWC